MAITMIYPIGSSDQVTLILPGSNWENPAGYLSADDINRAFDGTLLSYRNYLKRTKSLKWEYLTPTQKAGLETIFAYGGPFSFADYEDSDNQFTALMMSAPQFQPVARGIWSGEVEVQEI
jgi:hypothetical protein